MKFQPIQTGVKTVQENTQRNQAVAVGFWSRQLV